MGSSNMQAGRTLQFMGIYEDLTKPEISSYASIDDGEASVPPQAVNKDAWAKNIQQHGNGADVVYIDAKNQKGSLLGMLQAFRDTGINIVDMSRPVAPSGNGVRGFYFVLEKDAYSKGQLKTALDLLELDEYTTHHYALNANGDLESATINT